MLSSSLIFVDATRWALRVLALMALGVGLASMYLFAMPRWARLHRAVSVVLLACPGGLLLAGGSRDVRVYGLAVALLALAVGVASKLRIAEWGAALLSVAVLGAAFWEWALIFLSAVDERSVRMNGQGTIGYAAMAVYWPLLILSSLAAGRWTRLPGRQVPTNGSGGG